MVVPEGVYTLPAYVFRGAEYLKTVTLPSTLTSVGTEAFAQCTSLKEVYFKGNAPTIKDNAFTNVKATAYYPAGNTTWTNDVFNRSYGGTLTWVAKDYEAPCNHTYGAPVTENVVDATCTENGSYDEVKTCSVCGEKSRETIIVNATGHTFDQEKVDEKYLVSEGVYYKSCKCGEKGTETFTVKEEKPEDKPVINFKDVPTNAFYYDAVMWAVGKGVTTGTSADTFSPDEVCNRGQVVTFLWRAAGKPEPTATKNPFKDVQSTDFFYKAVLWAAEKGITTGTSATTFSPNETCNRGQVVTFLSRALKGAPKKTDNPFTDVAAGAFYYNPVLWAVENGITTGTGNGTFSPNAACNRGQVITFLYRAYK